MNSLTTMILTFALSVGAQCALAADLSNDSTRHVEVHFADLDLGRVEGAASLYKRLQLAAEIVCMDDSKDLARVARTKACISDAISTAVAQVNRPILSAYYRSKLGIGNAALREAAR